MTVGTKSLSALPVGDQFRIKDDKTPPPKRQAIAVADQEAAPEPR